MNTIFLKLLNMSAAGSVLILAVVLLRALLKRAPRWILCAMWALVAVRLLCPVSLPSPLSAFRAAPAILNESGEVELFRSAGEGAEPLLEVDLGLDEAPQAPAATPTDSAGVPNAAPAGCGVSVPLLTYLYLAGLAGMLLYAAASAMLLQKRLAASIRLDGNVFLCDILQTPFIFGILRPRIYLPSSLSEEARGCVLAHERAHLSRLDHIWKPLGFLILSLHWFNPLCLLAYRLFCRDMELACDEKVIRTLEPAERAAYSQTLLNCSAGRLPAACPVAFGETSVKTRVKAVLNYKKSAFWAILAALLAGLVLLVCFAAKPLSNSSGGRSFTLEENSQRNNASYPYLVRTDSATWYLSKADMELLGEDAYLDGFDQLLRFAEQDFADARSLLSGFLDAEIPPVNIYTDFSGNAEGADRFGAYYSTFNRSIRLFHGWDAAAVNLLHEYVHYLTMSCCAQPISEGFYAEAVAEYVANFACHNACARAAYRNVSAEEKALALERRIWDEDEGTVDPMRLYVGMAELLRSEYAIGMQYPTVYSAPMEKNERQLQEPMYTTASYYEAGSMMCYLVERFGLEKIAAVWSHSPSDMEQDLGKSYQEFYWDWAEWSTEKRIELDIAPPDVGS